MRQRAERDNQQAAEFVDLDLLLRLLEAPKLVFTHATLANQQGQTLQRTRLIETAGHEKVFVDPEDEDGTAFDVAVDPEHGRFGFRHPLRGWADVNPAALALYRPNLGAIFSMLLGDQLRQPKAGPIEVAPNLAWEVGSIWLNTKKRTDVWFARRLSDRAAWEKLQVTTASRGATALRLVLTSTPRPLLLTGALSGSTIVPVVEVLDPYNPTRIDMDRLRACFTGHFAEPVAGPIHLSDDNSRLRIHGKELVFRGPILRAIIRVLYDAHRQNKWLRAADILEKANSQSDSLDQACGKRWKDIRPFLENDGHLWRLAPST